METKQFFYKAIVYTVYLEEMCRRRNSKPLTEREERRILYSLEDSLSSRNRTCIHLYKWIIYFCPFLAHRYGCRFMNNVKRAYMTQKNNHSLGKYIEGALDMTVCSKIKKTSCEEIPTENSRADQIIDSLKELKSMLRSQSEQKVDYSRFKNSELRDIINDSFRKLSVLCSNVTELDRDKLIILVQYVTATNGLLCI